MGHYADEKTRLVGNQTIWQLRADMLDPSCSSKTVVIKKGDKVYVETGAPDYVGETPRDTSGDTVLHTYTGTGGGKAAIENWRAANTSATSGDMYDFWSSYIVNMNDDARAAEKVKAAEQVTDLTADIAHLQKIIDNGEDTTNIS
ncbi:uncharacterized protein METZ01_LOCUS119733 [marine metagenome]|uniref:Uncharacterized protein n=1 Tax=marine metagenome TaxID=408172 RepID=A0A381XQ42_9ZZZZ